jgi:superfamily II DNA or RNA helicase
MKIILSNKIEIINPVPVLLEILIPTFTIENPVYKEAVKHGRWTGNIEQYIYLYEEIENALIIPRGYIGLLLWQCKDSGFNFEFIDKTRTLEEVNFEFKGRLREYQKEACKAIYEKDFAVLQAPTGSGKTVIALALIVKRKQPTLIVVHTKELLYQWQERINQFLKIPVNEIGIIGAGKFKIGTVTVALIQSLYKRVDEVKKHFGYVIIDECHHIPSRTFTEAVSAFDSKYMTGLSATPYRRDGLTKLISFCVGMTAHRIEESELIKNGSIMKAEIILKQTGIETLENPQEQYSRAIKELSENQERNYMIAKDVVNEVKKKRGIALILSDRVKHIESLYALISKGFKLNSQVAILIGAMKQKDRKAVIEQLKKGRIKVLISTSQLISEGFDMPNLSSLFLSIPIRFKGRLLQSMGRVLRTAKGKDKAIIYDYIDMGGVWEASARARQRVYDEMK